MTTILAIVLALLLTTASFGQTLVFPVRDLLMNIPEFRNAPRFNLNDAMYGRPIENANSQDRIEKKQLETKLIQIMWTHYPEAKAITIWNRNLIIKL